MATFFWKDFPDMDHMHFYVTYRKFPNQGLVGSSAPSCCIFQVYIPANDCTHITTPTARAWQQAAKSRGLTKCHGPRPAAHAHFFHHFFHILSIIFVSLHWAEVCWSAPLFAVLGALTLRRRTRTTYATHQRFFLDANK